MDKKNKVKIELEEVDEGLFRKTLSVIQEGALNKKVKSAQIELAKDIYLEFSIAACVTDGGALDGNKLILMVQKMRALLFKERALLMMSDLRIKQLSGDE